MDKFRHKLPKDALKRHAKDVSKALVSSDYKHNRVDDPTAISDKQEKKVKKYVKDFFDKAVLKHRDHEKRKTTREVLNGASQAGEPSTAGPVASVETPEAAAADEDVTMSDVEDIAASSPVHKRKRDDDADLLDASLTPEEPSSVKRLKEEEMTEEPSPPPPPPPPPDAAMEEDLNMTPLQAEAFSREQEEAKRLADEDERDRVRQEEALQRENEEAMREFELEQESQHASAANGKVDKSVPDNGRDCGGEISNRKGKDHSKPVVIGQ